MTAQLAERLRYQGEEQALCTQPLSDYFAMGGNNPGFDAGCTALWRGYVGTWEIKADRLYLIGLQGTLVDGTDATLATLFPGFPTRVFAHWYSGYLRIPQGGLLEYVHQGYGSTYESDLFLEVERGILVATRVRNNGKAAPADAPQGYGIGAMTLFPPAGKHDGGTP